MCPLYAFLLELPVQKLPKLWQENANTPSFFLPSFSLKFVTSSVCLKMVTYSMTLSSYRRLVREVDDLWHWEEINEKQRFEVRKILENYASIRVEFLAKGWSEKTIESSNELIGANIKLWRGSISTYWQESTGASVNGRYGTKAVNICGYLMGVLENDTVAEIAPNYLLTEFES